MIKERMFIVKRYMRNKKVNEVIIIDYNKFYIGLITIQFEFLHYL